MPYYTLLTVMSLQFNIKHRVNFKNQEYRVWQIIRFYSGLLLSAAGSNSEPGFGETLLV